MPVSYTHLDVYKRQLQVGVVAIPISKFMKKKVLGSLNMLSFSK